MMAKRVLPVLGVCLLAGSAACADQLGFVDCASHTDATPVFAKARKSQDIVANLPCGERFKVIVYGFVFSEIQTSDGKIGFIYSNVVTVDAAGGTLQSRPAANTAPSLTAASEKTKIYAPRQTDAAPAQVPAPVPAPQTAAVSDSASAPTASTPAAGSATDTTAATSPAAAQPSAPAPPTNTSSATPSAPAPASAIAPAAPAAAPPTLPGPDAVLKATATSATSADAPVDPNTPTPAPTTAPTPAASPNSTTPPSATPASQPAPPDAPASAAPNAANTGSPSASAPATTPDAASSSAASAAPIAQPDAAPAAPAQPAADAQPQPAPPASTEVEPGITPAKTPKQRWEKPNPGARSASLLELFGGFSFASMSNGTGYANNTNFMGGMGSFGLNIKPWIQVVGDTSYSFENSTGIKNVIYGNHYGPRFFLRGRTKWAISPFGEVLVGGSRADTTVAASGGNPAYTTSQNCFSIKAGGGVDLKPSRMFEIRLIDVDYYRTAFGTNVHQSNYWVSTGVVIRLMKPWWE